MFLISLLVEVQEATQVFYLLDLLLMCGFHIIIEDSEMT